MLLHDRTALIEVQSFCQFREIALVLCYRCNASWLTKILPFALWPPASQCTTSTRLPRIHSGISSTDRRAYHSLEYTERSIAVNPFRSTLPSPCLIKQDHDRLRQCRESLLRSCRHLQRPIKACISCLLRHTRCCKGVWPDIV